MLPPYVTIVPPSYRLVTSPSCYRLTSPSRCHLTAIFSPRRCISPSQMRVSAARAAASSHTTAPRAERVSEVGGVAAPSAAKPSGAKAPTFDYGGRCMWPPLDADVTSAVLDMVVQASAVLAKVHGAMRMCMRHVYPRRDAHACARGMCMRHVACACGMCILAKVDGPPRAARPADRRSEPCPAHRCTTRPRPGVICPAAPDLAPDLASSALLAALCAHRRMRRRTASIASTFRAVSSRPTRSLVPPSHARSVRSGQRPSSFATLSSLARSARLPARGPVVPRPSAVSGA